MYSRDCAETINKDRRSRKVQENVTLQRAVERHLNLAEAYHEVCEEFGGPFLEGLPIRKMLQAQQANTIELRMFKLISDFQAQRGRLPTQREIYEEMAYTPIFRAKLAQQAAGLRAPWDDENELQHYWKWQAQDATESARRYIKNFQWRYGRLPTEGETKKFTETHVRSQVEYERYMAQEVTVDELKKSAAISWSTFRRRYWPLCREVLKGLKLEAPLRDKDRRAKSRFDDPNE
jgi:hypothetical protein